MTTIHTSTPSRELHVDSPTACQDNHALPLLLPLGSYLMMYVVMRRMRILSILLLPLGSYGLGYCYQGVAGEWYPSTPSRELQT